MSTASTFAVSRKHRLRELEKEIRSDMEEFYWTGKKLKEIRDDELYREDGFTSWEEYCRQRWEWTRQRVTQLIVASEYREKLPNPDNLSDCRPRGWSEWAVRELTRIPDKKQAARVAAKAIKAVESTEGAKLTASVVRKFVDEDLGITRSKPGPRERDDGVGLFEFLHAHIGATEGVREALERLTDDNWRLFIEEHPRVVKRLATACESLAALLRNVER